MKIQKTFDNKVDIYGQGLNKLVAKYVGFDKIILDVGCCQGRLGQYLKDSKRATVYGIDVSNRAIKLANKCLEVAYLLDIETDDLPFPKKSFDVIICADILEHLRSPVEALIKLKAYLKDGGWFVLSIPNVANLEVRWNLLWGNFDYQKSGIMDDSHLRFYTQKTVRKLLTDAKIKIVKIDYSPGCSFFFLQGRVLKWKFMRNLHNWLTKISPSLFCAQFIIVAKS